MKKFISAIFLCVLCNLIGVAQDTPRQPSQPIRRYLVKTKQSVADLEKSLRTDNKVEDLVGGAGMELRVAVQHDKKRENTEAELHDASDDVYYVLEGEAKLTLGGHLDAPHETTRGEWRSKSIVDGETFTIKKGDLIIVPRGTPHQRTTIKGKEFSMILIKIFADPLPAQK